MNYLKLLNYLKKTSIFLTLLILIGSFLPFNNIAYNGSGGLLFFENVTLPFTNNIQYVYNGLIGAFKTNSNSLSNSLSSTNSPMFISPIVFTLAVLIPILTLGMLYSAIQNLNKDIEFKFLRVIHILSFFLILIPILEYILIDQIVIADIEDYHDTTSSLLPYLSLVMHAGLLGLGNGDLESISSIPSIGFYLIAISGLTIFIVSFIIRKFQNKARESGQIELLKPWELKSQKQQIKQQIMKLSNRYSKLYLSEITERIRVNSQSIINIIQEMVKNKEFYAEYDKESQSILFKSQDVKEIDELMATFQEWEREGKGKKRYNI
jgi:hypothetical protein